MSSIFRYFIMHYRRTPLRTGFLVFALLVASAGLSSVLRLNQTALSSFEAASEPLISNLTGQIEPRAGEHISKSDFVALRRAGFYQLVPVLRQKVKLANTDVKEIELLGVDIISLLATQTPASITTDEKDQARFDARIDEIWQSRENLYVSEALSAKLQSGTMASVDGINTESGSLLPPMKTVSWPGLNEQVIGDIALVQNLTDRTDISALWIVGNLSDNQLKALDAALSARLERTPAPQTEDASQLTASFRYNLIAMSLLMFVVCLFIVASALNLLYQSRVSHLRILRQLGVGRSTLSQALIMELIIITLVTVPLGWLAGIYLAEMFVPTLSATLSNLYGVAVFHSVPPALTEIMIVLVACLSGALAAATLPVRRLSGRLTSITTDTKVDGDSRHSVYHLNGMTFMLALGAFSVALITTSIVGAFTAIALTLIAMCTLLLSIIPAFFKLLSKIFKNHHLLLRWSLADARQIASKSSVAFCAFFIAITSNLAMNMMVESFRSATETWLSDRLAADLYVYSQSAEALDDLYADYSGTMELYRRTTLTLRYTDELPVKVHSWPEQESRINGIGLTISTDDFWTQFVNGKGIFVNQQWYFRHHLTLGQEVELTTAAGDKRTFILAGVYTDFGNPDEQGLLPSSLMAQLNAPTSLLAASSLTDVQESAIRRTAEAQNGVTVYAQDTLARLSMSVFDRTFVVTDAINLITLAVAILSLIVSMFVIGEGNVAKHALLKCMGAGTHHLAGLALFQYFLVGATCVIVAFPASWLLSWQLIELVNLRAFDWTYPLIINPMTLLWVSLISLTVLIACLSVPIYWRASMPLVRRLAWLE